VYFFEKLTLSKMSWELPKCRRTSPGSQPSLSRFWQVSFLWNFSGKYFRKMERNWPFLYACKGSKARPFSYTENPVIFYDTLAGTL
jgi:hypothetical protein